MEKRLLILTIASFFSIGLIEAMSDYFIFMNLIVPLQSEFISIPIYWWFILFLPTALVCVALSYFSKSIKELFFMAFLGTLSSNIFNHFAAINEFAGHKKSWAIEGAYIFWSFGLALQTIFYLALMLIGYVIFTYVAKNKVST